MTVYQALKKSNIDFTVSDSEIIGTKASIKAREMGIMVPKTIEYPWHKKEKNTYLVNDFPELFIPELFSLIAAHFTVNTLIKRRKRIIKTT
jgi:hypothetical protein